MNLDLEKAMSVASKACQLGRTVLLNYYGKSIRVQEKPGAGLVSDADVETEMVITEALKEAYPEIEVLGEEAAFRTKNEAVKSTCWILDPLDGTTNYVHRIPLFCISLALQVRGELVLGIVDLPVLKRTYSCIKGEGAFANGEKLSVSSRKTVSEAVLGTGFSRENSTQLKEQLTIFSGLVAEARGVRRIGSAAYDLCLVADGSLDGFWEPGLKPWDVAAGALMVREAGGLVCNYDGHQYKMGDETLVAGGPKLFTQFSQKIKFFQHKARL